MMVIPFILSARGGMSCSSHSSCSSSSVSSSHSSVSHSSPSHSFTSESHSYRPSVTSKNYSSGTRTINKSTHVNTVKPFHSSEPINTMSPTAVKFYSNNPSYIRHNNNYVPLYHHNSYFWYYVIFNNRRHRNDTIRAKNKSELIQKVDNHRY